MKFKLKDVFFVIIVIFYSLTIILHCFFKNSDLNKNLSSKILFAHFYSFTILFGCIIALIFLMISIILIYKNGYKNLNTLLCILVFITSLILIGFSANVKSSNIFLKGKSIKIVEWNVANKVDHNSIYKIFGEFDTDIAVFPELEGEYKGEPANNRLKRIFETVGIDYDRYEVFTSTPTIGNIAAVTIVTKKSFSKYIDKKNLLMTTFGTLYLKSGNNDIPDIIGLHTAPPLPGLMSDWNNDLKIISQEIVKNNPNALIIGDFNATLRHGSLNDITTHEDVLDYSSLFNRGTWPSSFPVWISTQIDHILIPKNKYLVKNVEILKLGKSDHRAIFVELLK